MLRRSNSRRPCRWRLLDCQRQQHSAREEGLHVRRLDPRQFRLFPLRNHNQAPTRQILSRHNVTTCFDTISHSRAERAPSTGSNFIGNNEGQSPKIWAGRARHAGPHPATQPEALEAREGKQVSIGTTRNSPGRVSCLGFCSLWSRLPAARLILSLSRREGLSERLLSWLRPSALLIVDHLG